MASRDIDLREDAKAETFEVQFHLPYRREAGTLRFRNCAVFALRNGRVRTRDMAQSLGEIMRVDHIPCGLPANASEELAIQTLLDRLRSLSLAQRWILLTNLAHSVDSRGTPEEIDTLAIGSTGVQVIEVKHWGRGYLKSNSLTVTPKPKN